MFELIIILLKNIGLISVMTIILTRLRVFQLLLANDSIGFRYQLFFILFFGSIGIYGTYSGLAVNDAVLNSRVIGPFVGGIVGGPIIGLFSGLLAGVHRYAINPDGFTSLACVIITPLQGLVVGLLKDRILRFGKNWQVALLAGMIAEMMHMLFVLIFSKPFSEALAVVKVISTPMVISNSIGIAVFVLVLESLQKDKQIAATFHAKRVLDIAKDTLGYLRKGLTVENTRKAAEIILNKTNLDAVSFTNTTEVLAHVGVGNEFHSTGEPIKTTITQSVLESGVYQVGGHIHRQECSCPIKYAVVVPIVVMNEIVGSFKMYKVTKVIDELDIQLALGLTNLFNQQLELALIAQQALLLQEAEYHALQSQINPHFLFNALNTISSVIRTSSERGRELVLSLADYLRGNMNFSEDILFPKELEHIKAYLDIEKARFGDKLKIIFDFPDNLNFYLPPLTLQPLIENAIKHGVRSSIDNGEIILRVNKEDNGYQISVLDNGKGVNSQELDNLFLNDSKTDSVGLKNINQRLIIHYGEQSALVVKNRPERGVVVSFYIPILN